MSENVKKDAVRLTKLSVDELAHRFGDFLRAKGGLINTTDPGLKELNLVARMMVHYARTFGNFDLLATVRNKVRLTPDGFVRGLG